jgi:hypothetical protein
MNQQYRPRRVKRSSRSAGRKRKRGVLSKRKQFERQFNNGQLKKMLRKDAKQLSIQEKIYKLASYLETNKLLEEKKRIRDMKRARRSKKKVNQSLDEKRR